jgi:hypothetical protein
VAGPWYSISRLYLRPGYWTAQSHCCRMEMRKAQGVPNESRVAMTWLRDPENRYSLMAEDRIFARKVPPSIFISSILRRGSNAAPSYSWPFTEYCIHYEHYSTAQVGHFRYPTWPGGRILSISKLNCRLENTHSFKSTERRLATFSMPSGRRSSHLGVACLPEVAFIAYRQCLPACSLSVKRGSRKTVVTAFLRKH